MKRIDPEGFTRAPHFAQAVAVPAGSNLLYVAGQVAGDGFAMAPPEDFEQQVEQTFDRIETILKAGGMHLSDIVKVNGFISDRANVATYRKTFLKRLGETRPVSTLVIANLIDPRLLVEIEVVAARAV
jgi:enamine deaminase RidA (YjgF/YER057c/UK114 family)